MDVTQILILICAPVSAYGILVIATTYAKSVIIRNKNLKHEKNVARYNFYGKRLEYTKETLEVVNEIIHVLVLIEFHLLDDTRGIEKTNVSHYQKMVEKISNEVIECLKDRINQICFYTLLDEKYLQYYIIRHTELCIKAGLNAMIHEEEPAMDLGGN